MSKTLQFIIGKLRNFAFDTLRPNVTDSDDSRVPIIFTSNKEKIISRIKVDIRDKNTTVWLFGTVGFRVNSVIFPGWLTFKIWRGEPNKGKLIFSTTDVAQGGFRNETGDFAPTSRNTSFTTTDFLEDKHCHNITYYLTITPQLTATFGDPIDVRLIGPITFITGTIQNE